MAADGRTIPGYYFDPEKKKYFKVEKNHVAVPASRYSQESVKQIQDETRKRKRAATIHRQRQAQTVQRCRAINDPTASGTFLDRELGTRSVSSLYSDRSRFLVSGWRSATRVDLSLGLEPGPPISCFDRDTATGGLLVGCEHGPQLAYVMSTPGSPSKQPSRTDCTHGESYPRKIAATRSTISSIHVTSCRTMVMTSAGSSVSRPSLTVAPLMDPVEASNSYIPIDTGYSTVFELPKRDTIWTSSPNPFVTAGVEDIAIGCNDGVFNLHRPHWEPMKVLDTDSDVLALEWTEPRTLACGLRNSAILLWDLRSKGHSFRLSHSDTVTGIKSAGHGSRIIVDGLRDSLSLYDLRMVKTPKESSQRRGTKGRRSFPKYGASKPLVKFQSEGHQFATQTGYDVNTELGVVISAGDKDALNAYSMHTGKTIKRWRLSDHFEGVTNISAPEDVIAKCAKFSQDDRGCPTVLVSFESSVIELHWNTDSSA